MELPLPHEGGLPRPEAEEGLLGDAGVSLGGKGQTERQDGVGAGAETTAGEDMAERSPRPWRPRPRLPPAGRPRAPRPQQQPRPSGPSQLQRAVRQPERFGTICGESGIHNFRDQGYK